MKLLFDNLSADVSKMTTRSYSTSFSMGIYFLHRRLRNPIYAIYGFVRLADEIVDSFAGYDRAYLLAKLKLDMEDAIKNRISTNPLLNSFQYAVHQYKIDPELTELFMKSMEMDLSKVEYTSSKYNQYILGSAEAVGLMCLHVFTEGNKALYDELRPYAMKLGAAFQKVNFLRDMKDDYETLGRIYFPNVEISKFTQNAKAAIEKEIESDFAVAYQGIVKLPASSRGGVYLAYIYYQSLFKKIKSLTPDKVLLGRVRIHNGKKLGLMFNSLLEFKMNLL